MTMATLSPIENELVVCESIKSVISDMRSLDAMKQDAIKAPPVINSNSPRPSNNPLRTHNSRRTRPNPADNPGFGGPYEHPRTPFS